jgi:hypothetical protein
LGREEGLSQISSQFIPHANAHGPDDREPISPIVEAKTPLRTQTIQHIVRKENFECRNSAGVSSLGFRFRPSLTSLARDFDGIEAAGHVARDAVWAQDIRLLAQAVSMSYAVQQAEGMAPLPSDVPGALAYKYCGGGFGGMLSPRRQYIPNIELRTVCYSAGYALYIFESQSVRDMAVESHGHMAVEPYISAR